MQDYERIARVIKYVDAHHTEQPDLATLARQSGLSPFHFHRLFARWTALTPNRGTLVSYGRLADAVGDRRAARAVGSAVGRNPVACLIPCHRVIRETGAFGEYRWGDARKKAIVAWETAPTAPA